MAAILLRDCEWAFPAKKMATGNLQLDFYFVVKVLTLRFLQVGALIFLIIACLVFLYKSLKVRAWLRGA